MTWKNISDWSIKNEKGDTITKMLVHGEPGYLNRLTIETERLNDERRR